MKESNLSKANLLIGHAIVHRANSCAVHNESSLNNAAAFAPYLGRFLPKLGRHREVPPTFSFRWRGVNGGLPALAVFDPASKPVQPAHTFHTAVARALHASTMSI